MEITFEETIFSKQTVKHILFTLVPGGPNLDTSDLETLFRNEFYWTVSPSIAVVFAVHELWSEYKVSTSRRQARMCGDMQKWHL